MIIIPVATRYFLWPQFCRSRDQSRSSSVLNTLELNENPPPSPFSFDHLDKKCIDNRSHQQVLNEQKNDPHEFDETDHVYSGNSQRLQMGSFD
jgi:hypothetical protein